MAKIEGLKWMLKDAVFFVLSVFCFVFCVIIKCYSCFCKNNLLGVIGGKGFKGSKMFGIIQVLVVVFKVT